MSAASTQKSSEQEEQYNDLSESSNQLNEAYSSEVSEISQGAQILQFMAGLGIYHVSKRSQVIESFQALNNKHIQAQMMRTQNPQDYENLKRHLENVEKEFERNTKKNKGQEPESVKVGIGPYSQTMTLDELKRKKAALSIAETVHTQVNISEIEHKYSGTQKVYQLSDESMKKLKGGYKEWAKTNKGKSLDEYLVIQGRNEYLKENNTNETKIDKETRKKQIEEHEKALANARREAVKENHDVRLAGHKAITEVLDSSIPLLSNEELELRRIQVATGQYKKSEELQKATPASAPQPLSPPLSKPAATPTNKRPSFKPPSISFPKINFPKIAFPRIPFNFSLVSNFKTTLVNKLGGTAIKAGIKSLALKAGLSSLVGAMSGGSSLLAQAGLELLKKIPGVSAIADGIEGAALQTAKWAAIGAVGVVVGVILLVISPFLSNGNFFPPGLQNAHTLNIKHNKTLSWLEFEQQYIQTRGEYQNISYNWGQFEKDFLNKSAKISKL